MIDLRCGDCLDLMGEIAPQSIDLILCDLPYGLTQNRWDQVIPLEPLWVHYRRLLKPRGAVVLTASQPFTSMLVMSNPEWFRHEWVWIKDRGGNFANTCREPMKEHDTVLVFSPGGWTYNRQMQDRNPRGLSRARYPVTLYGKSSDYGAHRPTRVQSVGDLRVPSSCQRFNREVGLHPTQKPVALMEYLVRTYSNEGDTVLDNAMGSGTTPLACHRTGRSCIGIDLRPDYVEIARSRLAAARAETPLFA